MTGNPFKFNKEDPMGVPYAAIFYSLLVVTVMLAWASQPKVEKALGTEARRLKWLYLAVWYVCVAGDWLQGPYVYALYDAYGFSRHEISQLFVAGFGASMVFGTFVGSFADKIGRKRGCQLYCMLYIASCMTKHFANYWVLMVGRVTGGIATSLLFSGFESWLVSEACEKRSLDKDALGHIFALMWFGNSLVAILAGILGDVTVGFGGLQKLGETAFHVGGFCSPFDLAIILLVVGLLLISFLWEENYGSPQAAETISEQDGLAKQVKEGVQAIAGSKTLIIVMMMVACFEGSMYTFVFNWTPALSNAVSTPAFGMVFASFMMAYMCGSSTFDLLRGRGASATQLAQWAFGLGAAAFLFAGCAFKMTLDVKQMVTIYIGFILFEFCCGLYFPSVSTIKGQAVPESIRSTVYNLYRVPMNAIVLAVLLGNISMTTVFVTCFVLLASAGLSINGLRLAGEKGLGACDVESYGSATATGH
jgi:MFS family permease